MSAAMLFEVASCLLLFCVVVGIEVVVDVVVVIVVHCSVVTVVLCLSGQIWIIGFI